ncbi:MAG: 16S rRNA (cytosine(1402)-N(4))-methyltransferase RsmH [Planctomycetaceae bacterium]
MSTSVHLPVLLHEVLDQLDLRPGLTVVDGTVGAGGHSSKIAPRIAPGGQLIGLDRDPMMLAFAAQKLEGLNATLIQSSYAELAEVLKSHGLTHIDRLLVDLGLSSDQLADRERGFGFAAGGPLDMRFDTRSGISAAEFLRTAPADEIARVFREWGEEPAAEPLAQAIVGSRKFDPVETAADLVAIVERVLKIRDSNQGSHPATRVFQALRIHVNRELDQLTRFLDTVLPQALRPGGRAVVITFHSIEDRIVKQAFRDSEVWENLTKKPIIATPTEVRLNPRSRTAKLRCVVRKS